MEDLSTVRAREAFDGSDDDSFGVVRVLNSSAGTPGDERAYERGDEALVEAGLAEWVVAPVHKPSAGRRLDHDAEREPTPLGRAEAYPLAGPTTAARRAEARDRGVVDAHVDKGLGEKLAARRAEVASDLGDDADVRTQASLGSLGARSGPVTARSDLAADKQLAEASVAASEPGAQSDAGDRRATPARPSPTTPGSPGAAGASGAGSR